jgi:lipoprotein-anchoring transpeptidase ErfK/SrfK
VPSCKPAARPRSLRAATALSLGVLMAGGLAACNGDLDGDEALDNPFSQDSSSPSASVPQVKVTSNVKPRRSVPVDRRVQLKAAQGTLTAVQVRTADGGARVPGELAGDGSAWKASGRLEPGTTYRIKATAEDQDGLTKQFTRTFTTDDLTLDEQTYPSLVPGDGATVGVGMPVILRFDVGVEDKANFERHLSVETTPVQKGSWHWVSDNEVHWRPKTYWRPGTKVDVEADINSVSAGNGIYGQENRSSSFTIGDALIMRVDVANHNMKVLRNGKLLRTIPISAGKPGFTTRSGTKVIVEKHRYKRMNAATTGISRDDPEFYDLSNVEYAQRVTYSGEFIHAAPWSVGSQGYANVSHGCVGMSTEAAGWLYNLTKIGDPVETTGTDRQMDLYNGYGDWNASFAEYKKGSALS